MSGRAIKISWRETCLVGPPTHAKASVERRSAELSGAEFGQTAVRYSCL